MCWRTVFVSERWWSGGSRTEEGPSLEVDGDCGERDGAGVAFETSIASPGEAVDVLEEVEDWLDGTALLCEAVVAIPFPASEWLTRMAAAHDAIGDAALT